MLQPRLQPLQRALIYAQLRRMLQPRLQRAMRYLQHAHRCVLLDVGILPTFITVREWVELTSMS